MEAEVDLLGVREGERVKVGVGDEEGGIAIVPAKL